MSLHYSKDAHSKCRSFYSCLQEDIMVQWSKSARFNLFTFLLTSSNTFSIELFFNIAHENVSNSWWFQKLNDFSKVFLTNARIFDLIWYILFRLQTKSPHLKTDYRIMKTHRSKAGHLSDRYLPCMNLTPFPTFHQGSLVWTEFLILLCYFCEFYCSFPHKTISLAVFRALLTHLRQ